MNLSNLKGYPQALYDAIKNDSYSKGDADFSITELLKPARQRALQIKHAHEIEEDVEDRIYTLVGQVGHLILERAGRRNPKTELEHLIFYIYLFEKLLEFPIYLPHALLAMITVTNISFRERLMFLVSEAREKRLVRTMIIEERLFAPIPMPTGALTLSGQVDSLSIEDGVLVDWKFTTSWGFMANQKPKPEWTAQLNMQLELLRINGFEAKSLQIIGILRDHQKSRAKEEPNYPQTPIARHDIPIWEREKTRWFIAERITAHNLALNALPNCSPEERWAKGESWGLMRPGQKKAVKVSYNRNEAVDYAEANNLKMEFRPSDIGKRCGSYCSASKFCQQYQMLLRQQGDKRHDRKQGAPLQAL